MIARYFGRKILDSEWLSSKIRHEIKALRKAEVLITEPSDQLTVEDRVLLYEPSLKGSKITAKLKSVLEKEIKRLGLEENYPVFDELLIMVNVKARWKYRSIRMKIDLYEPYKDQHLEYLISIEGKQH